MNPNFQASSQFLCLLYSLICAVGPIRKPHWISHDADHLCNNTNIQVLFRISIFFKYSVILMCLICANRTNKVSYRVSRAGSFLFGTVQICLLGNILDRDYLSARTLVPVHKGTDRCRTVWSYYTGISVHTMLHSRFSKASSSAPSHPSHSETVVWSRSASLRRASPNSSGVRFGSRR